MFGDASCALASVLKVSVLFLDVFSCVSASIMMLSLEFYRLDIFIIRVFSCLDTKSEVIACVWRSKLCSRLCFDSVGFVFRCVFSCLGIDNDALA